MALSDVAALALHPLFVQRVQAAMVTAAVQIGAEVLSSANPDRSRLRHALSVNVLQDSAMWAPRFAWACAQNQALSMASTDNDIQFTVNSVWDAMAGVVPPSA